MYTWNEFKRRPDNLKLSIMEAKAKYNKELITFEEMLILQSRGGGSLDNVIDSVGFKSDFESSGLENGSYTQTTSDGYPSSTTVLPLLNGFTASIEVTFKYPVKVTGNPKITTVTNNDEGNIAGPSRGTLEFDYSSIDNGDKTLEFIYVQATPGNGTNPNALNMRASQLMLGGDPSYITEFSSSLTANTLSGVSAGTYSNIKLEWAQASSNYITSASVTATSLSASVEVGADNELLHINPNTNGLIGTYYTDYLVNNTFTIAGSEFGLVGPAGSAVMMVYGDYLTAAPSDSLNRFEPYVSNSINIYTGLYGDTIYIEDEIGNNGLGEIDLNGGTITNLDDGGTVSLAINDTVDGGVVYNVFKVYALE